MEKIVFMPEDGTTPETFYVLDTATLAGRNYLLVTDEEEGDGIALVFREEAGEDGSEPVYEIVEEDRELDGVLTLFADTLNELGIDLEVGDEQEEES